MSAPSILPERSTKAPASSTSQQLRKLTTPRRNDLKWESYKREIHSMYIGQGKSLHKTMRWFEQEHGLRGSERHWKSKINKWKFHKNVSAKERRYIAGKAWVRELEEGKKTTFYRNDVRVNQKKLERFKKLNLSEIDRESMPATPKHIDYETPKPHFNDQDPVGSLEDGDEFITASRQISPLETPNEYPGPDDDNSAANVAGQSSEILSSTLELELGTGKRKWKKIQQLLQDHIEELEPALKPLKEDLRIARELLDRGQRSRAETEYFKAVQKYINQKWKQDDPLIIAFVTELVEHFNSCTEDEMSTSVSLCLGLLQNFLLAFSPDSKNHSLVWAALDSLLWTHPGVVQEINMQRVIAALHDPDADERLCSALRSSLGRMPPSGNINEKGFRLSLLAFACHLKEYLEGSSLLGSRAAFSDLHKTLIYLWHSQRSFRSDDFMEGALVNDIHSIFVSELVQGNLALDKCYSSIEPSINRLAFASSVLGWFGEAEALFTVLRSTPSLKLITSDRGTEISVQYCLHLEIQKRYAELLLVLYDAYADFENSYKTTEYLQDYLFGVRRHILDMRDILNKVPGPLAQYVSSEKALEIVRLGHLTRKVFPISPISADREAEDDEDVEDVEDVEELIMEMDQNKVEDDGEQMDDCRSSNKFGVTYTESIITGISFNYSDLYWRWG